MKIKKLKKLISYMVLLSILNCCAEIRNISIIEKGIYKSQRETQKYMIKVKRITILSGDTLFTISKKYKVTSLEIIKLNKLASPYILKPGKKLKIPSPKRYKIKRGDTLTKIAKCFSVTINDIKHKNDRLIEKKLIINSSLYLPYYSKNKCKQKKIKIKTYKEQDQLSKNIFQWPTEGSVITNFGKQKGGRRNDGINILAPRGNPVRAALSGKVIYRGNELPAWGNLILIKHKNNWTTAYAHLDKFLVRTDDIVKTGDIIGSIGATGNVEKFQLHFQVRKNSKPLDPLKYLRKKD